MKIDNEKHSAKDLGQIAELLACAYLEKNGLTLIKQNFRCRLGEIDLIMADKEELVFIEVRYRQNNVYGGAIDSIDKRKCQKLIKTAYFYLQQNMHRDEKPCRFDVMIIYSIQAKRLEWIRDAFRLDD